MNLMVIRIFSTVFAVIFGAFTPPIAAHADACKGLKSCSDYSINKHNPEVQYNSHKIALVVGTNKYYKNVSSDNPNDLDNAVNDAKLVGTALAGSGFEVRYVLNPTIDDVRIELSALLTHVRKADKQFKLNGLPPTPPTVYFYFAGHGAQDQGKDKLIFPITDPKYSDESQYLLETNAIAQPFGGIYTFQFTFIFDACRSRIELPNGTGQKNRGTIPSFGTLKLDGLTRFMTVFSTSGEHQAADAMTSPTNQGPFAFYLARYLAKPGLTSQSVFGWTQKAVHQYTKTQSPSFEANNLFSSLNTVHNTIDTDDQCAAMDIGMLDVFDNYPCDIQPKVGDNQMCTSQLVNLINRSGKEKLVSCQNVSATLDIIDPEKKLPKLLANSIFISSGLKPQTSATLSKQNEIIFSTKDSWNSKNLPSNFGEISAYVNAQTLNQPYYYDQAKTGSNNIQSELKQFFPPSGIQNGAGVPIDVLATTNFHRFPSPGSPMIYSQVPPNAQVFLDCQNLICNDGWNGASIYFDGKKTNPVRTYFKAGIEFKPKTSLKLPIAFDSTNFTFEKGQLEQLLSKIKEPKDISRIRIWLPPDNDKSAKFLKNLIVARELKKKLGSMLKIGDSDSYQIPTSTLLQSALGEDMSIVEVFLN